MRSLSGWITVGLLLLLVAACNPPSAPPPATPATPAPPQPARVQGEVHLEGQTDFEGIQAYIPGTSLSAITDHDGRFALDGVGTGKQEVFARAEGYKSASLGTVDVIPSSKTEKYTLETITLQRRTPVAEAAPKAGAIHGVLVNAAGEAVDWSGCTIGVDNTRFRTAAMPDGTFLLWSLPPNEYHLSARMAGFDPATATVRVLPGLEATSVSLTMNPTGPAEEGSVVTVNLTPGGAAPAGENESTTATAQISGMAVKNQEDLNDMSGISVALAGTSQIATTDAGGNYSIEKIKPGTYQLVVQAEGFVTQQLPLTLKGNDDRVLDTITLEPKKNYPTVLSADPPDGTRNVMIKPEIPVMIRFSKKMNAASLRDAVRIQPAAAFRVYSGREQPDTDFDLMKVIIYGVRQQPTAKFRTRYTLTVAGATDVEGLAMQKPFSMNLTTGEAQVIRTDPGDGARDVMLMPLTPVSVFFNAVMDPKTLNSEVIRISPSLEMTPAFSMRTDPDTGWTNLSIMATWKPDTQYRVTIGRRARTVGDITLSNTPYTFSIRTAKLNIQRVPTAPQSLR